MSNLTLVEAFKIVEAHAPESADAVDATSDVINCKNLKKLSMLVHHCSDGGDTDIVFTWYEGTDVAFGTNQIITAVSPIWYNIDTASADLFARATDAATFTIDTGAGLNQLWVVEWDCALFSAGYDCFRPTTTGGNAANYVNILYFGESRYQSDVNVSAITD